MSHVHYNVILIKKNTIHNGTRSHCIVNAGTHYNIALDTIGLQWKF